MSNYAKRDWLSGSISISGRRVKQIKFDIDTDSYTQLMSLFNESVGVDTDIGYKSLEMSSSKTPSSFPINLVFDKRTRNKVAIHDGHHLYEIGFANNGGLRHFKDACFTEFGYKQMFAGLLGARIDREVFRNSVMDIMSNPGDCAKWVHSAGVLAFMIGEAGKFLSIRTVVRKVMCLDMSITLDGFQEIAWESKEAQYLDFKAYILVRESLDSILMQDDFCGQKIIRL